MRHGLHLQANGSSRSSALAAAARRTVARRIRGDPSQKNSMSSWSEATSGVRCRTIGRFRCRLRGSRYSRQTVPSAARSPFSRGSGYSSNFAVHAWARAQTVESFLVSRGFAELGSDAFIDDRESHAAHAGWASRKPNASSIFVKTSIRLIAHDIAGVTPHPSCSSEYGIRS